MVLGHFRRVAGTLYGEAGCKDENKRQETVPCGFRNLVYTGWLGQCGWSQRDSWVGTGDTDPGQ